MLSACRNGNLEQIKALVASDKTRGIRVDEVGFRV